MYREAASDVREVGERLGRDWGARLKRKARECGVFARILQAVLRELRELRKKLYRSVVVDLDEFGNLDDPTSPIQVTLVLVTIVRALFAASLAVQFRRRFAADGITCHRISRVGKMRRIRSLRDDKNRV